MRREIYAISFLFILMFVLISLLSYNPLDPSIFHQTDNRDIHNIFGLLGASVSGILIGLFGAGAFWIPFLILLIGSHVFRSRPLDIIIKTVIGGFILIITTGSLFACIRNTMFGKNISSGGAVGNLVKSYFIELFNPAGSALILLLLWIIGFMFATGFSIKIFFFRIGVAALWIYSFTFARFFSQEPEETVVSLPNSPFGGQGGQLVPLNSALIVSDREMFTSSLPVVAAAEEQGVIVISNENFYTDDSIKTNVDDQTMPDKDDEAHKELDDETLMSDETTEADETLMSDETTEADETLFEVAKPRHRLPTPKKGNVTLPVRGWSSEGFQMPPLNYLDAPETRPSSVDERNLEIQGKLVESKLEDFRVNGKVIAAIPGPVITTFEYEPASGVKINKILNLTDDLALALRATSIRIVAPIPGKAAVGIEIPNKVREIVRLKDIVGSEAFRNSESYLTICLGKDIEGEPVVAELDKMPHLLIAGATGAGKSVGLNAMICSMLYKSSPDDVKFIMIDPKKIELSVYNGIPHLITPVVTDPKKATHALFWAVSEMERRYELLSEVQVRNISRYNQKVQKHRGTDKKQKLPYIVIIIDELADLMMVASKDVEVSLARLAQMARAAGIHLILATQRPSVDVLTGVIKANFPTRISYLVSSKIDSRTIIDANGAENLLGNGDMLFLPPGTSKIQRVHGAYISEEELTRITDMLKEQRRPEYDYAIVESHENIEIPGFKKLSSNTEYDDKYDAAVAFVKKAGKASVAIIQKQFNVGYNRAARIIRMMEKDGIVGAPDAANIREVKVNDE